MDYLDEIRKANEDQLGKIDAMWNGEINGETDLEKARKELTGGRWVTIDGRHVYMGSDGEVKAGAVYNKDGSRETASGTSKVGDSGGEENKEEEYLSKFTKDIKAHGSTLQEGLKRYRAGKKGEDTALIGRLLDARKAKKVEDIGKEQSEKKEEPKKGATDKEAMESLQKMGHKMPTNNMITKEKRRLEHENKATLLDEDKAYFRSNKNGVLNILDKDPLMSVKDAIKDHKANEAAIDKEDWAVPTDQESRLKETKMMRDLDDNTRSLLKTAQDRLGADKIPILKTLHFADQIAKHEGEKRELQHIAEAINYQVTTPAEMRKEQMTDPNLAETFVKRAIEGGHKSDPGMVGRLKELGLNEYSAIGKEVNDKFMNLQEKISGLSSSAKTMFRFGVEKLGMNLMEAETLSKMVDKNVKLGVEDDYAVRDAIRDSIESKKTPEQKTQDVKQFKENKSQFVDMAKTSKDGKDFYNKVTKEIKTGTFSGGQFGGWFNKEYGASTPQKSLEKFMKDVKSGKFDDKKQITKSMNYQDEIRKANTDQMNKIDGLWKCDSTKKKKEAIEDELNEEDKNKLIKKAVESGDLSDLPDEIGKALTTVLEAKEDGSLAELLKGGKVAQIGETRMHGGKKMKKTAKGWEPAGEGGEKGKGEKKDSPDDSDKIEKFYQNMLWSIGEDKHFATKEIAIYALRENGKNRKKAGKTAESKMMFDVADKLEGGGKNTNKLDGFKSDVRDELKRMDYTDDQIDKKLKKESNFLKEASEQNQHYTKVAQQLR